MDFDTTIHKLIGTHGEIIGENDPINAQLDTM